MIVYREGTVPWALPHRDERLGGWVVGYVESKLPFVGMPNRDQIVRRWPTA